MSHAPFNVLSLVRIQRDEEGRIKLIFMPAYRLDEYYLSEEQVLWLKKDIEAALEKNYKK
jgi:hypothetical protein